MATDVNLADYRKDLATDLTCMMASVRKTKHLTCVFDATWQAEVQSYIKQVTPGQKWKRYMALLDFRGQPILGGGDFINRLDSALESIHGVTRKRKSLRAKTRALRGLNDQYYGAVFEILILGTFAESGALIEYEPKCAKRIVDGLIDLAGTKFLIEITINRTLNAVQPGVGFLNPCPGAKKIESKIADKVVQAGGGNDPLLLFTCARGAQLAIGSELGLLNGFVESGSSAVTAVLITATHCPSGFALAANPCARVCLSPDHRLALEGIITVRDFPWIVNPSDIRQRPGNHAYRPPS